MTYDRGCWLWLGSQQEYGHGQIGRGASEMGNAKAHVVSWLLNRGPIPKGQWVLHKCDNAQCVNPDHLYLGNAADNNRDAAVRGRNFHKLTNDDISQIRLDWPHKTQRFLANKYGVVQPTIWNVVHKLTWKHVA